jgi:hypothetical protein
MPRKPKHPKDMTTDEAMRHLFGRSGAAHAKKAANPPEKPKAKGSKSQVKSTRDESSD